MLYLDEKYALLISSRLRNFKKKREHLYNFSCPFCGDSKKNKYRARGYLYREGDFLRYKCHNCSTPHYTLSDLLEHIDKTLYNNYWFESFRNKESENRETNSKKISRSLLGKVKKKVNFDFAKQCSRLSTNHFCYQYLINRKIPEKFFYEFQFTENFKEFILPFDTERSRNIPEDSRLVIPFYNEFNELIAFKGRSFEDIKSKYTNFPLIDTNDIVYGLDRVDFSKEILVCEGEIDSLFLTNSLAAGTSSLNSVVNILIDSRKLSKDQFVLVFDNESRNKEVLNIMNKSIKQDFRVVIWPSDLKEKDINEMIINEKSSEDILYIIKNNIYRGLSAKTTFAFWRNYGV